MRRAALSLLLAACGATTAPRALTLDELLVLEDPTLEQARAACSLLVERGVDVDEVERVCLTIEVGYAPLRGTGLTSEQAMERGVEGVDAEALSAGLGAWMELQELAADGR